MSSEDGPWEDDEEAVPRTSTTSACRWRRPSRGGTSRIALGDGSRAQAAAGPRGRERVRRLLEYYQHFFEDAPREPAQPRVPLTVVEAAVAGVFGLLFNYVSTQRTRELPGLLPEVTYFVLVPFIGPRAAA